MTLVISLGKPCYADQPIVTTGLYGERVNLMRVPKTRKIDAPRVAQRLITTWNSYDAMRAMLIENLGAWEGEEDSVKEEHAELIAALRALVEGLPDLSETPLLRSSE